MAKKITAPNSYDPGKGRPKEYLAYLNEREMAYLRSINGNNMERGPRGLPSFPPNDAIGSSSKAGSTKSTTSSGAGRDSSRGLGQGAGGAAVGKSPSGSGPSGGGNLGGGGKGAAGSSPSSPGGLRGAGGNYGPGSGKPGTSSSTGGGYKGPSSPMGGQGTSISKDTRAQQETQVRNAISAVKNTPAFRGDASSGGIRTLSVGPVGTQVNVGRPTSSGANFTGPKAAGTISKSLVDANKYSSPLTPGMTPEDMARRGATMDQIEKEIRDMYRDDSDLQKAAMENSFGKIPSGTFQKVSGVGSVYSPDDEFYQSVRVPSWNQSMPGATPTPSTPNETEGVDATNMSTEEMVEALRPSGKTRSVGATSTDLGVESWENTPYGEPGDITRKKDIIDKYGKYIPGTVGVASRVKTKVHDLIWGGMSQEERIDRINKNNRMDQDRLRGLNGDENDRGPRVPPPEERIGNIPRKDAITAPKEKTNGPRPAIYYRWDLGMGVPSPSDSDYTLYTKYLQEKAAAKAGFA